MHASKSRPYGKAARQLATFRSQASLIDSSRSGEAVRSTASLPQRFIRLKFTSCHRNGGRNRVGACGGFNRAGGLWGVRIVWGLVGGRNRVGACGGGRNRVGACGGGGVGIGWGLVGV